jgi:hypothetical protein
MFQLGNPKTCVVEMPSFFAQSDASDASASAKIYYI